MRRTAVLMVGIEGRPRSDVHSRSLGHLSVVDMWPRRNQDPLSLAEREKAGFKAPPPTPRASPPSWATDWKHPRRTQQQRRALGRGCGDVFAGFRRGIRGRWKPMLVVVVVAAALLTWWSGASWDGAYRRPAGSPLVDDGALANNWVVEDVGDVDFDGRETEGWNDVGRSTAPAMLSTVEESGTKGGQATPVSGVSTGPLTLPKSQPSPTETTTTLNDVDHAGYAPKTEAPAASQTQSALLSTKLPVETPAPTPGSPPRRLLVLSQLGTDTTSASWAAKFFANLPRVFYPLNSSSSSSDTPRSRSHAASYLRFILDHYPANTNDTLPDMVALLPSSRTGSGVADTAAHLAFLNWPLLERHAFASLTDSPPARLFLREAVARAMKWRQERGETFSATTTLDAAIASAEFRAEHSSAHRLLVVYKFLRDHLCPLLHILPPDILTPSAPRVVVSRAAVLSRPREVYVQLLARVEADPDFDAFLSLTWGVLWAARDDNGGLGEPPSGLCQLTTGLCLPMSEVRRVISEGRIEGVLPAHGWDADPAATGTPVAPRIMPAFSAEEPPRYFWDMRAGSGSAESKPNTGIGRDVSGMRFVSPRALERIEEKREMGGYSPEPPELSDRGATVPAGAEKENVVSEEDELNLL
ncbi:hypothetical protein M427DRAFT_26846 [Gonapodya prolifera JEL478]|uniref:Uncharacterized protein n=1 Tax=Gonapodya prolifera (strain JEL478) TaxID=1344416 RepID=A0A139AZR3_GONPJ|nr:hypothetical protein M427DRAFT_26846 [Gonapodya prolifera JEL478]|eukprot:KXS22232.1 hypothetical protein M427DRAFT_26846 [Gonapodya prolifera JEL478]